MPLITDPDDLDQRPTTTNVTDFVVSGAAGATATITSAGSNLPALVADQFFAVRNHSDPENNGLWQESGGTPTTGSVTATKISGQNPINNAVGEAADIDEDMEIHLDTGAKLFHLFAANSGASALDNAGVTMLALHSFFKEEWKNDAALPNIPFPMIGVDFDAGKWEFGTDPSGNFNGWKAANDTTRKLIRNAGWREFDNAGVLKREYFGAVSLGAFEDAVNDLAYFVQGDDPTDTAAATDFDFAGPVNEPVLVFEENVGPVLTPNGFDVNIDTPSAGIDQLVRNDGGSWITDGYRVGAWVTTRAAENAANDGTFLISAVTASNLDVTATGGGDPGMAAATDDNSMVVAKNFRNRITLLLRVRDADPNGKTFAQAGLADAGETIISNKVIKFPLANITDLKIAETDANIAANSPYTQILARYFDAAYNRDVDTPGSPRDFGMVIDVGTHSGVDGVSNGTVTFTTAEAGIPGTTYDGGTLIIHEGTDKGSHAITTATGGTVTLGSALAGSETSLSFTLQRAAPVAATAEEIYEKVQYLLRQAADIDSTDQTVTGRTADALLAFVGERLDAGSGIPTNPNGGGSGVFIEGFDANDTNRLRFFDNAGTQREFPFVAAGTIAFNPNLVNDSAPEYWMFYDYTERFTNTGFGISGASGSDATLDSSTTDLVAELADGDYIALSGFADAALNGIWLLTGAPAGAGPWTAPATKVDRATVANEAAGASVNLDKNPFDSPDSIIVDNNAGADIAGAVPGATANFDFDYDGNTQGGRTAATDAAVRLKAIGLETGQEVVTTGTITRATGISFSLVSALERNYSNP